jgi:tRNA (guanine-N7-)-methyltransferase
MFPKLRPAVFAESISLEEIAFVKQIGGIIERMRAGSAAPDRHANPYLNAALQLEKVLLTSDEVKANFPSYFENTTLPVVLEIGCYLGKSVLEFSQANPQLNILGLDITYKRVVKSAKKIKLLNLENARIGICEGKDFLKGLKSNSLLGVCLFFPDPWPKKKQAKNRLVQTEFFEILHDKLCANGFFWFKTDSESYFNEAIENIPLQKFGLDTTHTPLEFMESSYVTSFEELFISKNLPIYRKILRKI